MTSSHSGTQITGRCIHLRYNIKNLCFKHGNWYVQKLRIINNGLFIDFIVSGIHYQKNQFKFIFSMFLDFLHQLCHNHRIFSARHADSNFIALFNQVIGGDPFDKRLPQSFFILCNKSSLYFFIFLHFRSFQNVPNLSRFLGKIYLRTLYVISFIYCIKSFQKLFQFFYFSQVTEADTEGAFGIFLILCYCKDCPGRQFYYGTG